MHVVAETSGGETEHGLAQRRRASAGACHRAGAVASRRTRVAWVHAEHVQHVAEVDADCGHTHAHHRRAGIVASRLDDCDKILDRATRLRTQLHSMFGRRGGTAAHARAHPVPSSIRMALSIGVNDVTRMRQVQCKLVCVRTTSQSWMSKFLCSRAPQTTYRGAVSTA